MYRKKTHKELVSKKSVNIETLWSLKIHTLAIAMLRLVMKSSIMSALMIEFSFGNKLETSFAKGE